MNYDISIIIPVYNSEHSLETLVQRITAALGKLKKTFEIVFVDDCSRDNSWGILRQLHAANDNITIIQLTKNFSEHNAVIAGLNNSRGEFVIIMDDDCQNPPEELHKLIETAESNDCDVVYTYYDKKKHSLFRNLGSAFVNSCANLLMDKPRDLYLSSFKLIRRVIVEKIVEYKGAYTYIDGLIFYFTSRVATVKVEHHEREIGKSNYDLKKLLSLWINISLSFSIVPLRLSFVAGLLILLVVFGFTGWTIVEKFILKIDVPLGFTSLIVLFSLGLSFNFILIGILGEYIGRTFLNINKKPQFAVRVKHENRVL